MPYPAKQANTKVLPCDYAIRVDRLSWYGKYCCRATITLREVHRSFVRSGRAGFNFGNQGRKEQKRRGVTARKENVGGVTNWAPRPCGEFGTKEPSGHVACHTMLERRRQREQEACALTKSQVISSARMQDRDE